MIAPAAPTIDAEFNNKSSMLSSFITTIFTLGYMVSLYLYTGPEIRD